MAYNISALPAYTDEQSRAFVTKSILEADTIKLLADAGSFDPTAKGSQAIQLLDTDITIQDGTSCGRNSLGGATLSQAILTVKDLKVNQDYCVRDLEKTYAVEDLKAKMKGQIYDDALFMDSIGSLNSEKVSASLEQLVWQGNVSLSGTSTTLGQFNGFIYQISGTSISLSAATASGNTTVTAKLRAANAAMPIAVSDKPDYRIFIGRDTYNTYLGEIADKNLFNPNDPFTLFGTNVKLQPVAGLNGTNIIIATRMRNLRAGGEMVEATFQKKYDFISELVFLDSRFSLGCVAVYPQEIGYVKYA